MKKRTEFRPRRRIRAPERKENVKTVQFTASEAAFAADVFNSR